MFARLLASFCLLSLAVPLCRAGSDDPPERELVVFLKAGTGQPAHTIEHMKRELAPLMAAAGYRVEWRDSRNADRNWSAPLLAVVELLGACDASGRVDADAGEQLASTSVADGVVLPFSRLNCGILTRMLAPSLAGEAGARRDYLYGRAMARVLAHELYHVIARTGDHGRAGVAKPAFRVSDLLTERFEFEEAAIERLGS